MGVILNPRGTSGSGKTTLARRILAEYGWRPDGAEALNRVQPIYRADRSLPFAYRLLHPGTACALIVVGHYEVTSGGCDTIRVQDGGLPEALRFAGEAAASGHDVLIEGLQLSGEVELSTQLAARHDLHVILLSTPLEQCASNLVSRRRAARSRLGAIEESLAGERRRVENACAQLRPHATVEVLDCDAALRRARAVFGLE